MKKFIYTCLTIIISCSIIYSQDLFTQEYLQFNAVNHEVAPHLRYKIYPTFNMWTYLKLDTRTGRIAMLQIATDSKDEGEFYIGTPNEVYVGDDAINGRYELYPTSNMWTFIMIDQINGNSYHVQWSNKKLELCGLYKII